MAVPPYHANAVDESKVAKSTVGRSAESSVESRADNNPRLWSFLRPIDFIRVILSESDATKCSLYAGRLTLVFDELARCI